LVSNSTVHTISNTAVFRRKVFGRLSSRRRGMEPLFASFSRIRSKKVQLCIDRPIELPAKPLVNCSVLQTHSFDELAYCYYSLLRHIQAAYTSTQTTQTQTAKIHLNRPTAKIQQRKYKSKSIELRTLSHPTRNRATAAGPEHNTDARTHPDAPRPHQERSTVPVHQPRPQHPRPTDHCTGHPTSVG